MSWPQVHDGPMPCAGAAGGQAATENRMAIAVDAVYDLDQAHLMTGPHAHQHQVEFEREASANSDEVLHPQLGSGLAQPPAVDAEQRATALDSCLPDAQAASAADAAKQTAALLPAGGATGPVEGYEQVGMSIWFEVSANSSRLHFHTAADGRQPLGLSVPLDVLAADDHPDLRQIAAHLLQSRHAAAAPSAGDGQLEACGARNPGTNAADESAHSNARASLAVEGGEGTADSPATASADSGPVPHSKELQSSVASESSNFSAPVPSAVDHATLCGATGSLPHAPQCRQATGVLGPSGLVQNIQGVSPAAVEELISEAQTFAREWGELRAVTRNRLHGRILLPVLQVRIESEFEFELY